MLAPSLLDVVQCMLLIIKFVSGKFCDLEVNHENNPLYGNMHGIRMPINKECTATIEDFYFHVCIFFPLFHSLISWWRSTCSRHVITAQGMPIALRCGITVVTQATIPAITV